MLSLHSFLESVTVLGIFLLTSCGTSSSQTLAPPPTTSPTSSLPSSNPFPLSASPSAQKTPPPPSPSAALNPGTYCYRSSTPTLDATAKLTLDRNSNVKGTLQGTIHNKKASYYSSYQQNLSGVLKGKQVKMAIATTIENDHQLSNESWTMTRQTLKTQRDSFAAVDCSPLNSSTRSPVPIESIQFESNTSSTTLKGAVVRGDRKIYNLNALKNQTIILTLTSLENNAVFDLRDPKGKTLKREATSLTQTLPSTGGYHIIIGGTRGNTSYTLTVEVK